MLIIIIIIIIYKDVYRQGPFHYLYSVSLYASKIFKSVYIKVLGSFLVRDILLTLLNTIYGYLKFQKWTFDPLLSEYWHRMTLKP